MAPMLVKPHDNFIRYLTSAIRIVRSNLLISFAAVLAAASASRCVLVQAPSVVCNARSRRPIWWYSRSNGILENIPS